MQCTRRAFLGSIAAAPWPLVSGVAQVVDLGSHCLVPGSLAGFRGAIAQDRIVCPDGTIVPGADLMSWTANGPVLLECALGLVEAAAAPARAQYFPYVDFSWPIRVKIREFFPRTLSPRHGDSVVAEYAGAPVGVRRGSLILLGSPIGPSLKAGDPDARRWLASVLAWMHLG